MIILQRSLKQDGTKTRYRVVLLIRQAHAYDKLATNDEADLTHNINDSGSCRRWCGEFSGDSTRCSWRRRSSSGLRH